MAHHEQTGETDEWYTPPYIFEHMATTFDTDVAYPAPGVGTFQPCVPAQRYITSDSLTTEWHGFVWMNPPFGGRNGIAPWLDRFFAHGDGVALTPDRTSAPWWQPAARKADVVLFVTRKIRFLDRNGEPGRSPSTGTTLMAAGDTGVAALRMASATGLGVLMSIER